MSSPQGLLTRAELAAELRVSVDALERLIRKRKLPHFRAGRRYLFNLEEVLAHLRADSLSTPTRRSTPKRTPAASR